MVNKSLFLLILLSLLFVSSCSVNWFSDFDEIREEEFSVTFNFYKAEDSSFFTRRYMIGTTLASENLPKANDPEVLKFADGNVLVGWKFYRNTISKSTEIPDYIKIDEKTGYVSEIYVSSSSFDFFAEWGKMAEYKVYHFVQNEDDDEYTLKESESLEGVVGAQTEAALKDYEGFTAQSFIQTVISEDGSACVEIKYDRNKYTVKFDGNGASGNIPDISAKYGVEFTLPENTFASSFGFRSGVWNTEKDGSGTSYAANEKIKNLAIENNAVVTLYAQWEKVVHDSSGVASNPIENAKKIEFVLDSVDSKITKGSYIKINAFIDGDSVELSNWKVTRNYLGAIAEDCALLKSEDKTDSYSSEKSSAIYIFADTAWISGEYTLNVSAECNGIGISKEITIICE